MTTTARVSGKSTYTNDGSNVRAAVDRFTAGVLARNPNEPEFHQAVREVAESVMPLVLDDRRYRDAKILERMSEPDRVDWDGW